MARKYGDSALKIILAAMLAAGAISANAGIGFVQRMQVQRAVADSGLTSAGVVYMNGFERYDSTWGFASTDSGVGQNNSNDCSSSSWCLYQSCLNGCASSTGEVLINTLSATTLYGRFRLKFDPGATTTDSLIDFQTAAGATIVKVDNSSTPTSDKPCISGTCSSVSIPTNTWFLLETKVVVSTTGTAEVRINGKKVISISGNFGTTPIGKVLFWGKRAAGMGVGTFLDDVILRTDGYAGNGRVLTRTTASQTLVSSNQTYTYNSWPNGSGQTAGGVWGDADTTTALTSSGANVAQTAPIGSFSQYPDPLTAAPYFSSVPAISGGSIGFSGDGAAGTEELGVAFTSATSGSVRGVTVNIVKTGAPTDNMLVQLRSGSVTGTVLASATVPGSAVDAGGTPIPTNFIFSSPVQLSGGTTYYLVFNRTGAADSSNMYFVQYSTSDFVANADPYSRSGGTWSAYPGHDFFFKVLRDYTPVASDSKVNACRASISANRSTGSGRTFYLRTRVGGVDTDLDITASLTTSAQLFKSAFFQPSLSNLNLMEVGGVKSGSSAGQELTISEAWVSCDFSP